MVETLYSKLVKAITRFNEDAHIREYCRKYCTKEGRCCTMCPNKDIAPSYHCEKNILCHNYTCKDIQIILSKYTNTNRLTLQPQNIINTKLQQMCIDYNLNIWTDYDKFEEYIDKKDNEWKDALIFYIDELNRFTDVLIKSKWWENYGKSKPESQK